jgi:Adenomatosis polyposis coli down-regulated 1
MSFKDASPQGCLSRGQLRFALCLVVMILSVFSQRADVAAQAPDQESTVLAGHWASIGCEAATATAERSIRREFVFGDWSWRVDVTLYDGARCAAPLVGIRIEGSYVFTGPSAGGTGAKEATFFYMRKSAAALTPAGATLLTSAKCGTSAWRAGLVQDVLIPAASAFRQSRRLVCRNLTSCSCVKQS